MDEIVVWIQGFKDSRCLFNEAITFQVHIITQQHDMHQEQFISIRLLQ